MDELVKAKRALAKIANLITFLHMDGCLVEDEMEYAQTNLKIVSDYLKGDENYEGLDYEQ